ncbi:MAG: serine/threonine protein kinase [Candidatus Obscuribacterales bacterium]|nr:serine/threonine protein kinase [Candidatus Obscuribacterales bacterium]
MLVAPSATQGNFSAAVPLPGNNPPPKQCPTCRNVYPNYAQFCPGDATRLLMIGGSMDQYAGQTPSNTFSNLPIDSTVRSTQNPPPQQQQQQQQFNNTGTGSSDAFEVDPMQSLESQLIGRTIAGKYKIDSLLGEGGMAQVFKSTHLQLDKPVVIKIMHSGLPSMDTAMKRFEQECKVTARIDHPNVVSVFDVGSIEGRRPFLVMEYIMGESLRDYLDREVSMDVPEASTVMMQVCSGLHEAHQQGIVHRDLKPENIMLREKSDRPDWVKIVDFGIAHLKQGGQRLTRTGIAIGTVDYMSPEYLSDKPIDHRADIYALGVILYELIAGRCPFVAETAEAIMAKHLWGTPMPLSHYRPDLEAGCMFDQVAEKSLHKEPAERYQSVIEMRNDLVLALKEFEKR